MTWQDDSELRQLAEQLRQAKPADTRLPAPFYNQLRQEIEMRTQPKMNLRLQLAMPLALIAIFIIGGVFWLAMQQPTVNLRPQPLAMTTYDGWEMKVSFSYPSDWIIGTFTAEADAAGMMLGSEGGLSPADPISLDPGQEAAIISVMPADGYDRVDSHTLTTQIPYQRWLRENRANTIEPPAIIMMGEQSVAYVVHRLDEGIVSYEAFTLKNGRLFSLLGFVHGDELEGFRPKVESLFASLQAVDEHGWQTWQDPEVDFAIAYPPTWQLHNDNGKALEISTNEQPSWSSQSEANWGGPIIHVMHNLNSLLSDEPLAAVQAALEARLAQTNAPIRMVSEPAYLLPTRPDAAWAIYEDGRDVVFLGAVQHQSNLMQQPVVSLVAVAPLVDLDSFQPIFERILRSIRPKMAPVPIPPTDSSLLYPLDTYPPSDTPYRVGEGEGVWLVHTQEGQLYAFERRSPTYASYVNVDECLYSWTPTNQRFEDPCSGDKWTLTGRLMTEIQSELWSNRDLDQYPLRVVGNDIVIDKSRVVAGVTRVERVEVGSAVRVVGTSGNGLTMRDVPGKNGTALRVIPEGTVAVVLQEAIRNDDMVWWPIELEDGAKGWVVEAFLERVQAP